MVGYVPDYRFGSVDWRQARGSIVLVEGPLSSSWRFPRGSKRSTAEIDGLLFGSMLHDSPTVFKGKTLPMTPSFSRLQVVTQTTHLVLFSVEPGMDGLQNVGTMHNILGQCLGHRLFFLGTFCWERRKDIEFPVVYQVLFEILGCKPPTSSTSCVFGTFWRARCLFHSMFHHGKEGYRPHTARTGRTCEGNCFQCSFVLPFLRIDII